jgi:predicted ATPase
VTERAAIVGREEELAHIADLLHDERLVTLVGPGGIGKTRLAHAVASTMADRFPGGVFVIELVGSNERDDLANLAARQLGFDSLEGLHYRSIDHAVLVVLDNCESAIHQSATLAAELGDRASALRVLATSRAPLGSPGEHLVPVRPLRVPSTGDLSDARSCAAVQLFLERAARAGADLAGSDAVVSQVSELVRRLDGMPLAIELAAARSRVLSPAQLLERLEGHLELLVRPGDGTDRHRSIRAAIQTSYDPLPSDLKQFFRELGIIAAPFDVGLAHAVRLDTSDDETTTVELLTALIDTSLVESSQVGGGPVRYRLLEPIRLFASELSAQAGEVGTSAERYVDALVAWATQFAAAALDGFRSEVIAGLHENYAHLVHALDWCMAHDPTAMRANRLFLPLFGHSRPETVARAQRMRNTWTDRAPLHAEVLAVMGAVAMHGGSPALSKQWSNEALECADGSDLAAMIAQRTLGYLAAYAAEPTLARTHLNNAAAVARRLSAAFAREIELSCAAATAGPGDLDVALANTSAIAQDGGVG